MSRDAMLMRVPQQIDDAVSLRYVRDVMGKEVIAREEGRKLGLAAAALVDAAAMTLEAIRLKRLEPFARADETCVPLVDLRQIGDVVLVEDEVSRRPVPRGRGFVELLGMLVRSARGVPIGKVRELMFDPDTGEVQAILYDEYGLGLPLSAFDLYGVPVDVGVKRVTLDAVTIDERTRWLDSRGKLESAGAALKMLRLVNLEGDTSALIGARQQDALQQWEERAGMTAEEWYERYGGKNEAARAALPAPRYAPGSPRMQGEYQPARTSARSMQPETQQRAWQGVDTRLPQNGAGMGYREAASGGRGGGAGGRGNAQMRNTEMGARGGGAGQQQQPRPTFEQVLVKDDRARVYDVMQDGPRERMQEDSIDPRTMQ